MVTSLIDQISEDIVETIHEPLLVLDSDLKVILANRSFIDSFKVTREETLGRFIYDIGNKQWDIPKLRELLETILPEKISFDNYEVEHDFATIGRRVMLLNARQIERKVGQKPTILLAIEDITERKLLEDLLEESEVRYRRLFETASDGVLLLEKNEGHISRANPATTKLLGYSEDEITGKALKDVGFPDDFETIQEILQTLEKDGIIHHKDTPLKKKDGQFVDTDIYMVDKAILVQCNIRDVTERKRVEEALRENSARTQAITDSAQDAIIMMGPEGEISYWNPMAESIFGYTADEVMGQNLHNLLVPESYHEAYTKSFPAFQKTGQGNVVGQTIELRALGKNSREIPVSLSLSSVLLRDKWHAVGIVRDITEQKRAEKERQKLQAQFIQAQKMESVGRLAGGVAHDFNNMLGVILGHAEFALEKTDEHHDLYADLKEIQTAARRSADLTKQLLAFARKQIIAPKMLDLNDTVESMLNMLRRLIGEDINLSWNPAKRLWPVKMDPSQVDQILANLCVNARDAIEGVGKLTIETGMKTFDPAYCADHAGFIPGDFVVLAISDDGSGMDKDILENLFEPFFTTKEMGKGTGLGLATVYGIVKQNNGFINVYSEPDQGSTFKIYLPRYLAPDEPPAVDHPEKPEPTGNETILLVEDEPAILRMTRMMLERKGYSVLPAATPAEAIDLAKTHADKIHLLMTDVVMPEMNGQDLAKHLTALYPDIKPLFMSGYTTDVIAHQGVLDDGVAFIQKPFSMKELAEKVRGVLDKTFG